MVACIYRETKANLAFITVLSLNVVALYACDYFSNKAADSSQEQVANYVIAASMLLVPLQSSKITVFTEHPVSKISVLALSTLITYLEGEEFII